MTAITSLRFLICAFLIGLFTCCAIGYRVEYHYDGLALRTPQATSGSSPSAGETLAPRGVYPMVRFEDELAVFDWQILDSSIYVRIRNKTDQAIVALWEDASYIDPQGKAHALAPLFKSGNPSSTIRAGGRRDYALYPADYLATKHERGQAMFGYPSPDRVLDEPREIHDLYESHIGQSFELHVPIRVGEPVNQFHYEFRFTISNVEPRVTRDVF